MKKKYRFFASVICLLIVGRACGDVPELLWLPFDEQHEVVSDRGSKGGVQAELKNVQWAKGEFGTALSFGGANAFVEIEAIPAMRNANALSLSIWVMWQGDAMRSYPNILTSRTWSPGGMMLFVNQNTCSVRFGKPDTKGDGWREVGVSLLNQLPTNKWTHLCVTFERPHISTYVDGKKVADGKWDFPIQCDGLRLGGWYPPACHNGLMDDLRIYNRALSQQEVQSLATDMKRASAVYTVHDSKPLPVVADFENRYISFSVNQRGWLSQMQSKQTNRALLSHPTALVSAATDTGRQLKCSKVEALDHNRLRFFFRGDPGWVDLKISDQGDFFDIDLLECTLKNVERLTFFEVASALKNYYGGMANMLSDEEEGICLRGYDLPVEMSLFANNLRLQTTRELGLVGWRGGLAVGPRAELPSILRKMTQHAGVPYSTNGGAWSLDSRANKGSYLFADLSLASVDEWIELARRCGHEVIHLHGWWQGLGQYPINRTLFPEGEADLKRAVQRIHAAGLKAGMHTLTACINPRDPWVTPVPHPDLLAANVYTLSKDLPADTTSVYVDEIPVAGHDVVFTYSGNGNALRIGDEIIQYTRISRTKPYGFFDCKRGAFGTTAAAYKGGDSIDYLQQRYYAFYPKPDSALAEALARRLAHIFNSCEIDNFYFDGSEGMRSRYGIDFMRHSIMKKMRNDAVIEASCHGAHNWWFHSRLGAWDHPMWGMKEFHDLHVSSAKTYRKTDLLAPQLGWWAPRQVNANVRGHFQDEMEYFACKNMALESASSIQGVNVSHQPLSYAIEKQLTILGWYEKLRLAEYFDRPTLDQIAVPGQEFELRQNPSGLWRFTPVAYDYHRVSAAEGSVWESVNSFGEQPATLRMEALQRALPYNDPAAILLVGGTACTNLQIKTAPSVKLAVSSTAEERFAGSFKLEAKNQGEAAYGAWSSASVSFAPDYLDISPCGAVGLWVKGDGSGALLNVQLATPREHLGGLSEHYVTLNFEGWRYCEFHLRERDTRLHQLYRWPYNNIHALYRNPLNRKYLSAVNIYLNNIPAGGGTAVVLSPVVALPAKDCKIVNPEIQVNAESLIIPFTLNSGDFAEVDADGRCTHFNPSGDPLASVSLSKQPLYKKGVNRLTLMPVSKGEGVPRAELSLISRGEAFGSMQPESAIGWKYLQRAFALPRIIQHGGSQESRWIEPMSAGQKAKVEIELYGPVVNPTLTINNHVAKFDITLKLGERVRCRDQQNWQIIDSSRKILSQGRLEKELPLLQGGPNQVSFSSEGACDARLNLVKVIAP
ncbi:MAG: LamG domain-containing protein [Kiritimatiellia bacterium]